VTYYTINQSATRSETDGVQQPIKSPRTTYVTCAP